MSWRLIDPIAQAERVAWGREGYLSQRELERRDEDAQRYGDSASKQRMIVPEWFQGFRADVGANATTAMHVDFRSSTTAVATQGLSLDVPAQARVLLVRIIASADVTAGTATPQLSVTEGGGTVTYLFRQCELSTAEPRRKAARFSWETAVQIAMDATFQLQVVTDAAYAPVTNDYIVRMLLGYEEWISS